MNLPGAISDLQNVVNQRSTESRRASALTVSALPDGATVKSELTTALSLLAEGRPGLPDLGAAAAGERVHAVQPVQHL